MYKMKEVCARTGLTEKAIRYYVNQRLITPQTETGLHYQSYRFTDGDIRRLKQISALRNAEFSVGEIRQMLDDPSAIPGLIAEKEASLAAKISTLRETHRSLSQLTVSEQTDLSQIADAIDPQTPLRKETPKSSRNRLWWLTVYIALFAVLGLIVTGGKQFWLMGYVLAFLGGMEFPIMALGYFRYNLRYRKLPCKAEATVISVISDEGVGEYWEESSWDILRGLLHWGFVHWNWVRPDHWVPLLQFETDGKIITTAYRYGALKNSWKPGQKCTVAWEPGSEQAVYPCGDAAIFRKAWWHLLGGIGLLLLLIFSARLMMA